MTIMIIDILKMTYKFVDNSNWNTAIYFCEILLLAYCTEIALLFPIYMISSVWYGAWFCQYIPVSSLSELGNIYLCFVGDV